MHSIFLVEHRLDRGLCNEEAGREPFAGAAAKVIFLELGIKGVPVAADFGFFEGDRTGIRAVDGNGR